MADKRISELDVGPALAAADLVPVAREVSPGVYATVKNTLANIRTYLQSFFVDVTGDTMTGPLTMQNGAFSTLFRQNADGSVDIAPATNDQIVAINSNTASAPSATGQLITGRFRCAIPLSGNTFNTTVQSGAGGVASGLFIADTDADGAFTVTIRKNDGTPAADFQLGNYFSILQAGVDQVTIAGQTNVTLSAAPGFASPLKTRGNKSIVTCTFWKSSGGQDHWVVTGDLEVA